MFIWETCFKNDEKLCTSISPWLGLAYVLSEGSSFAQTGKVKANLLAYKSEVGAGMAALEAQSAHLNEAVDLGDHTTQT